LRSPGGKAGETLAIAGAGAGFVYGIACADYHDGQERCESTDAHVLGAVILFALVGGTALAIYSEATYKPPVVEQPASPNAQQLTFEAQQAALQGRCEALPALAQQVNALDAEYYTRVFYGDPAIQRCMQAR
jgi:hypothetical protein